jgi:hypothetical protein|tara:strand:- start:300 stop:776 length:477 start_codon:yes stop_codon:yes gene_type:complete
LLLIPIINWGQKVGDSISFNTIYNSKYNGTIIKIEADGYFFKIPNDRIIFLNRREIKEFQTYSLKNSNVKNLEKMSIKKSNITKELENNFVDIDKISSLIGKEIIIHLKDGRNLEGVIIKIIHEIDLIGNKYDVVKFLNSNKKMNIKTSLIESLETSK